MIAILDNDPFFLSFMHDVLTDEGYNYPLLVFGRVRRAHALLRRAQPNRIILDLWLTQRDDG